MCMCELSGKADLEMTYTVLGGKLSPTHSLIHTQLSLNRGVELCHHYIEFAGL